MYLDNGGDNMLSRRIFLRSLAAAAVLPQLSRAADAPEVVVYLNPN